MCCLYAVVFFHKRTFFLAFNIIVCLFLVFQGCKPNKHDLKWDRQDPSSPQVKKQIDQLISKIDLAYSVNPDSAVFYCHRLIEIYEKDGLVYGIFNINTRLAEIYLHRKEDAALATLYYSKSLKIMVSEKQCEIKNPYFYIDYGNILWINKLYDQAMPNFRKAIDIAKRERDEYAVAVGMGNIALTYSASNKLDSARFYFLKAAQIRKKLTPLLVADTYRQMCNMFNSFDMPDSVCTYKAKMEKYYQKHLASGHLSDSIHPDYPAIEKNLEFTISYLNALGEEQKENPWSAIRYYREAIEKAKKNEMPQEIPIGYYNIADIYAEKLHDMPLAVLYADSSYQYAIKVSDISYIVSSSKLLSELYARLGNSGQSAFYLSEAMHFTDSIMAFETSGHQLATKIMLITCQTETEMQAYKDQQHEDQSVINTQNKFIVALSTLLIVIGILLFRIFQNHQNLKEEHLRQMDRILNEIRPLEQQIKERKEDKEVRGTLSFTEEFEDRFLYLIHQERIYIQNNLSLPELAQLLNTNVSYLSQYINSNFGMNFNDYINSFRVKEACRLMVQDQSLKYSIDQIADMVGFNSRSTFYSTFNKFTGITPAFFRKNLPSLSKEQPHQGK
jgi:AraC-like DNA-binding protein